LWLVRHAQPLVAAGVCYGALDVPAEPAATLLAAKRLAHVLPMGANLTSSTLQRCEQLAQEICALRPDLTFKTDAALAEMNFGCWEGQRWDSIALAAYDAWTADFWQHPFGGAESVSQFMARVAGVWQRSRCADQAQVWITHAGVIRAVGLLVQGVQEVRCAADWPVAAPAYGQWITQTSDTVG
jgi:alpha-ribazole phosphatase